MQGMTGAVVLDGPIGGCKRLRNDLAAEDALTPGLMLGRKAPEEINLQALDIQKP